MERVLLFANPLRLDSNTSQDKGIAEADIQAFGFRLPAVDYVRSEVVIYLRYLAAAQKWDSLGGDVDLDAWTTKEGVRYDFFDAEIQLFIEQAGRENQASAQIYEVSFDLTDGFIVDAALVQRIKEEGKLLDVLLPYSGEGVQ